MDITKSTFLTLFRLICSPLFLPFLIVYTAPIRNIYVDILVAIVFLFLSFTDFLDGYFARKYKEVTVLGAMLDPIADKFLAYAALISLVAAGKFYFYWAILLIGREFFVMSLRMAALQHQFSIPVMMLGKIKTTFQTFLIAMLIINPQHLFISERVWMLSIYGLLGSVLLLSLGSAYFYTQQFMRSYNSSLQQSREVLS